MRTKTSAMHRLRVLVILCLFLTGTTFAARVNIFLVGAPGQGKSFTGNQLKNFAKAMVKKIAPYLRKPPQIVAPQNAGCTEKNLSRSAKEPQWYKPSPTGEAAFFCVEEFVDRLAVAGVTSDVSAITLDFQESSFDEQDEVLRVRIFDTPGMPDTNAERIAQYHDTIVQAVNELGKTEPINAFLFVQGTERVSPRDSALIRILFEQFKSISSFAMMINAKELWAPKLIDPNHPPKERFETEKRESISQYVQDFSRMHPDTFVNKVISLNQEDLNALKQVWNFIIFQRSETKPPKSKLKKLVDLLEEVRHTIQVWGNKMIETAAENYTKEKKALEVKRDKWNNHVQTWEFRRNAVAAGAWATLGLGAVMIGGLGPLSAVAGGVSKWSLDEIASYIHNNYLKDAYGEQQRIEQDLLDLEKDLRCPVWNSLTRLTTSMADFVMVSSVIRSQVEQPKVDNSTLNELIVSISSFRIAERRKTEKVSAWTHSVSFTAWLDWAEKANTLSSTAKQTAMRFHELCGTEYKEPQPEANRDSPVAVLPGEDKSEL